MVPETHAHILVHAMLLWNACVRVDNAVDTEAASPVDHVLTFVLLPLACFQIAVKFSGDNNCIQPTTACLAPVSLSFAELMYDSPQTQANHRTNATKAAVLAAEVLVLETLDFNVCMSDCVPARCCVFTLFRRDTFSHFSPPIFYPQTCSQ